MLKVIPMPELRRQYKKRWRGLTLRRRMRIMIPHMLWVAVWIALWAMIGWRIGWGIGTYVVETALRA